MQGRDPSAMIHTCSASMQSPYSTYRACAVSTWECQLRSSAWYISSIYYNKTTLLINIQYHIKYYSLHQCLVIIVQQVCHEGHLIGDPAHFIHSLSLNGGYQEEFQFPFFGFEPLDIKHS